MRTKTIIGFLATRNWIQRLLEVRLPVAAVNGLPNYRINRLAVEATRTVQK